VAAAERERKNMGRRQSEEREKRNEKWEILGFGGIYTPTRSGVRVSIAAHRAPAHLSH
jgi:hypothetical protein